MSDSESYSVCLSNLEVIIDERLETAKELGGTILVP